MWTYAAHLRQHAAQKSRHVIKLFVRWAHWWQGPESNRLQLSYYYSSRPCLDILSSASPSSGSTLMLLSAFEGVQIRDYSSFIHILHEILSYGGFRRDFYASHWIFIRLFIGFRKILESFLLMARPRSCYRTHTTFHHTPHCFGAPQIFHTLPGRSRAASLFFFLLPLAVCGGGGGGVSIPLIVFMGIVAPLHAQAVTVAITGIEASVHPLPHPVLLRSESMCY